MKSLIDEWNILRSGKGIYIMLIVPIVLSGIFGYVFKNGQINESPLAIVDLDHSAYSTQLINKLDASQYVTAEDVFHNYVDPDMLMYNGKYVAVLHIPAGLEANRMKGIQTNIGLYVDNTMAAATGNLRAGITEVLATENATLAGGSLKAMGLSDAQIGGMTSNMAMQQRLLYNPTNNTLMTSVAGFVNSIMLTLICGGVITIVPRLREAGKLKEEIRNPIGLIMRVIPSALVGCIAYYLSMGTLKQVGGLRFEVNVFQMFVPFFIYTLLLCLAALIVGWSAAVPAKASTRIIFLMLPSFLLTGSQLPIAMLPDPLQLVSNVLPLTWLFVFMRGMAFKGGDLSYFIPQFGEALILMAAFLVVIFLLILNEHRKEKKSLVSELETKDENESKIEVESTITTETKTKLETESVTKTGELVPIA